MDVVQLVDSLLGHSVVAAGQSLGISELHFSQAHVDDIVAVVLRVVAGVFHAGDKRRVGCRRTLCQQIVALLRAGVVIAAYVAAFVVGTHGIRDVEAVLAIILVNAGLIFVLHETAGLEEDDFAAAVGRLGESFAIHVVWEQVCEIF